MSDDYTWAYCNDQTVRYMVDTGEDAQAIIGQLAKEKKVLIDKILMLHSIAPRKVKLPGGGVAIWRCPDELVPDAE
jgi:hypothetical protein